MYTPINVADFVRLKLAPHACIMEPWFFEKGGVLIYAARGVGKTYFALGMAAAIATGGVFLGWKAPKPRRVIYIDGEMPAESMKERLAQYMKAYTFTDPTFLQILAADRSSKGLPDLGDVDGQKELEPALTGCEVIIVDNISTLVRSGKENEAESWAVMQNWILEQRWKGRAVILIHHANKAGDQRGSSKKEDIVDAVIRLQQPADWMQGDPARMIVTFTKSRYRSDPPVKPFEAEMSIEDDAIKWTVSAARDDRAESVVELHAEGKSYREIADLTGVSKSVAQRIIANLKPAA